jgi:hypothetical protein
MNHFRAGAAEHGFDESSMLMRSHDDESGFHSLQFTDHFANWASVN